MTLSPLKVLLASVCCLGLLPMTSASAASKEDPAIMACGCAPDMSLSTLQQISKGMFIGEAVETTHADRRTFVSSQYNASTTFKLKKVFYGSFSDLDGKDADTVTIRHLENDDNMCSLSFKKGKDYVITTDESSTGDRLTTYCFSGTALTASPKDIAKYYKKNPIQK